MEVVNLADISQPRPEIIKMDRYLPYFTHTGLIDRSVIKNAVLSIDNMFGSAENLIQGMKVEYLFQGQLTNKASENLRIENYRSVPTGLWLQWKAPEHDHILRKKKQLLFHGAISNNGDQLGIWDLKESIEVSPSGLMLIFIRYFAETLKKKGTIIISKVLSDKVAEVAKAYNLKVVTIDSGIDNFSKEFSKIGKRSALLYGDEFGRFWFKGQTLEPSASTALLLLAQICTKYTLSPGQLIDYISDKTLSRRYIFGKLLIPNSVCSKEGLEEIIRRDTPVSQESISSTSIFRTEDGAKISLVQDNKQDLVLIEVESLDEETTRSIIHNLQSKCFPEETDSEETNNTTA